MSPRSIRRAAERKAKKLVRKTETHLHQTISESVNATEPASEAGKTKSSLNAVKTELTGRTVVLPSEDAARYEQHVRDTFAEFRPVGPREMFLVQSLADTGWRMSRIPGLEMAILAYGRIQFADLFADHDGALRPGLIDMHTFLHYENQLRNLQLQEGRLRRQFEKDMAELRQVQQDRNAKEQPTAEADPQHDSKIGFEFSTVPIVAETAPPLESATTHFPSRDCGVLCAPALAPEGALRGRNYPRVNVSYYFVFFQLPSVIFLLTAARLSLLIGVTWPTCVNTRANSGEVACGGFRLQYRYFSHSL